MEALKNADVCPYNALIQELLALPSTDGAWAWWVFSRAEDRLSEQGYEASEAVQLALSIGLHVGAMSCYDYPRDAAHDLLRAAHEEEWFTVPVPLKPSVGEWYVWAPVPAIHRWIRTMATNDDEILYELRRKWTDADGGHRWKITLWPPDNTEVYIGYITDLEEAKAFADKAWAAWPEILEAPNAD